MAVRPPHRNDLTFPARDDRFDALVARLSEPTADPHADNLVSNEDSYPRVAAEIAHRVPPGAAYLGVGPDQNFTLMAHARPSLAFVVDFRRRNLLLHLVHKALFALAPDRRAYLERLTARGVEPWPAGAGPSEIVRTLTSQIADPRRRDATVAEVARVLRAYGVVRPDEWATLATIQAKLAGPGLNARFLALPMYPTLGRLIATTDRDGRPAHLLARDDIYRRVRDLQVGDRVVPVVGDFAGNAALDAIGDWLRERRCPVGLFYASDVEFFLIRSGKLGGYVANLGRLPWSPGALIVRTSTREIDHPERVAGDSSTTVVRDAAEFLARARAGRVRTPDDLFAPD